MSTAELADLGRPPAPLHLSLSPAPSPFRPPSRCLPARSCPITHGQGRREQAQTGAGKQQQSSTLVRGARNVDDSCAPPNWPALSGRHSPCCRSVASLPGSFNLRPGDCPAVPGAQRLASTTGDHARAAQRDNNAERSFHAGGRRRALTTQRRRANHRPPR